MNHNDIIDEMERWLAEERRAFSDPTEAREAEAQKRLAIGEKPSCSTGIHDYLTYGYGMLHQDGFWQYPLLDGEYAGESTPPPESAETVG